LEEEPQNMAMAQRQPQDFTHGGPVDSHIEAQINQSRGGGRPMEDSIRQPMEQAFGADFDNVRIHTNALADELNHSLAARAFTSGSDIFFRNGEYRPNGLLGKELLVHELVHVMQQSGRLQRVRHKKNGTQEEKCEECAKHIIHEKAYVPSEEKILHRKCSNGEWDKEVDGCSLPVWVTWITGAIDKDNPALGSDTSFSNGQTGPCDLHDKCYQTCRPSPAKRKVCDDKMLHDMKQVCKTSGEPPFVKERCFKYANLYHAGLRVFGQEAFSERQAQVCECQGPSVEEIISTIELILDSWWVSNEDMSRIRALCANTSRSKLAAIRKVIAPQVTKLTSHGQRAQLRVILEGN
jgi:hypothetical protein